MAPFLDFFHEGTLPEKLYALLVAPLPTSCIVLISTCFVYANRWLYLASGGMLLVSMLMDVAVAVKGSDLGDPEFFLDLSLWVLFILPLFVLSPAMLGFLMPLHVDNDRRWYCYLRPFSVVHTAEETLEAPVEDDEATAASLIVTIDATQPSATQDEELEAGVSQV